MPEVEQVAHGGLGRGPVVDPDEPRIGRRRPAADRRQVRDGGRVDDHGGQPPPLSRVEERIVGGHRVHDQAVDGGVADRRPDRRMHLRQAGHQHQRQPARVGDVGHAAQELHGGRLVEGVGQAAAEDDADRAGATAAQAARDGIGPAVAELGRGAQHALAQGG